MTIVRKCKASELAALMKRDLEERLVGKIDQAIAKTAADGVDVVRAKAPDAFGNLREGIEANGNKIQSLAPHAAPVEVGSRPHRPPFKPILEWVRLRGMQGTQSGAVGAPEWVAARIREHGSDSATPVDAAERVAWAVCEKIAREGTKPRWYMRDSVPEVYALLDANVRASVFSDD